MGQRQATSKPCIGLTVTLRRDGTPCSSAAYVRSVQEAGGIPVLLVPGPDAEDVSALLQRLDGLVLTGGDDVDPARYGALGHPKTTVMPAVRETWDFALTRRVLDEFSMPVLAICLGIQELNVALGGTLRQHIPDLDAGIEHRAPKEGEHWHLADVRPGTRLAGIVGSGPLRVNTRHHQAIDRLGRDLHAVAAAPDGIIEAVEIPGSRFVLGVQWHPERITAHAPHAALFRDFVMACGAVADSAERSSEGLSE